MMTSFRKKKLAMSPLEKRLMLDASLPAIAGQVLWLDADDTATILDAEGDNAASGAAFSGSVTTWVDKSASGFNVAAPTAAEQPTYVTAALNGNNVISLDGLNDRLINAGATIAGDDFTTFIVFNRAITAGRDGIFEMGGGASRNGFFINEGGTGTINYYLSGTFYNYTSTYVAGTYELISATHDTSAIDLRLNGTNELATVGGVRASTTGIFVGDDSSSGDQLLGNMAEIIVYDRNLSADERHDVENYLASKWALSITNTAPSVSTNTGASLNEGASITISGAQLAATDTDNTDASLIYTVTDAVDYGVLTNTNTTLALGLGSTFTQSDIDNGYISYAHNGSENFADAFSFTLTDQLATTGIQTFSLTINAVNEAPSFENSTLVSSENFEAGAAGWSNTFTENGGTYYTNFLGRNSLDGGLQTVYKTYALSGTQDHVTISFDMYEIDSWDGENFIIFVNDVQVFSSALSQGTFTAPVNGSSGAVSWTIQETTPFNYNFAFNGWVDQRYHYDLNIASAAATVKLGFSSTLNQAAADEAWGVDNIKVYEVGGNGTPGPYTVSELSTNGDAFGQVYAADPDTADTLTYTITGGTGLGVFAINPTTGVLTVSNAAALDYETTTSYTLNLLVTDSGSLTDTATITINVLDIPDNTAPVINALGPLTLNENATIGTALGTVTSTDAELHTVTYSITAGNTDNLFSINAASGQITLTNTTNLNYEWDNSYTLTITGTDNGFGLLTGTRAVTITINNINEAPHLDPGLNIASQNQNVYYNATTGNFYRLITTAANLATATTNAAALTINGVAGHLVTVTSAAENTFLTGLIAVSTWIGGSDAGVEGQWRWLAGPEAGQMFWLGAAAGSAQNGFYTNWLAGNPSDSGGAEDGMQLLTSGSWNDIGVTGALHYLVEWEGAAVMASVQNGPYSLAENSASGTSVGFAHAGDPDTGDTITYAITGGTGAAHFSINSATGEITLSNAAAADYELAASYTLTVQVRDVAGLTDTATVTVNITDGNDVPTALNLSHDFIMENSAVGTAIGLLTTTDADTADTHTYTLISNPGNKLTIVGNELRVLGSIDYELIRTIPITIRANDGHGGTYDRSFIINVGNEGDTFTPPAASIPQGESRDTSANRDGSHLGDMHESLIRATVRDGDAAQISAFYGLGNFVQILREKTTFELQKAVSTTKGLIGTIFYPQGALENIIKSDHVGQQDDPAADRFTNLRQALIYLNQMDEFQDRLMKDANSEQAIPDQGAQTPINPLNQQFVDVMSYHEQRQAHLRRALLKS